jgi:hypothetical protein
MAPMPCTRRSHADRAADRAERCAGRCAAAGANALARLWSCSSSPGFELTTSPAPLPACAASQAADHGASCHADRTADRADRVAPAAAPPAPPTPCARLWSFSSSPAFRVDDFARARPAAPPARPPITAPAAMPIGPPTAPSAAPVRRTGGCAGALGQVVFVQVVARFRIDDFARALAGHAAGDTADGGACDGTDRTGCRTDRAGQCTADGADAGADHVRAAVFGKRTLDVGSVFVERAFTPIRMPPFLMPSS